MNRKSFYGVLGLASIFMLSGCVVRTYEVTKDRIDQDLSGGNRGYLKGYAPRETAERKGTRTTQIVEVELHPPIRFERVRAPQEIPAAGRETAETAATTETYSEGNRGYITQSSVPEIQEPQAGTETLEKYTVQKGDTLQKISQKFYGTTRKWNKIFEANSGVLKAPNKIYPGQVINIPVEGLKETRENLK